MPFRNNIIAHIVCKKVILLNTHTMSSTCCIAGSFGSRCANRFGEAARIEQYFCMLLRATLASHRQACRNWCACEREKFGNLDCAPAHLYSSSTSGSWSASRAGTVDATLAGSLNGCARLVMVLRFRREHRNSI